MPVNDTHSQYDEHVKQWKRVRDVIAGEDAIKAAGTDYLPRLEGMEVGAAWPDPYEAYKERAQFYEATSRAVDGLLGMVFRKEPIVEVPAQYEPVLDNITQRGMDFTAHAKNLTREIISIGRHGILVDVGENGGAAYQIGYAAERILNWRVAMVDGRPLLSLVVLHEIVHRPRDDDPFATKAVDRYRVLSLGPFDEATGRSAYFQSLYEKVETKAGTKIEQIVPPFMPLRGGQPLDFIPFQFIGPRSLEAMVEKAPILPLVNTNLSHYRTSADLEHGAHFTALPTAVVMGGTQSGEGHLRIGSGAAWILDADADAKYLEYTGQGLGALEQRLERKEKQMATLGSRMLEDQKSGVEAAQTVNLRHRGENSLLASIAETVSAGLEKALGWQIWWNGGEAETATVSLNTDFFDNPLSPQDVVSLVDAWMKGGIGGEALFHNLREGERLPPDWEYEDFQRDIEQNGPQAAFLGMGGLGGRPVNDDDDDGQSEPVESEAAE